MGGEPGGAILIGSGASLARVDLAPAAGLPSIAFNRAYLAFDAWPIAPRYYACLDPVAITLVGPDLARDVLSRGMRAFLHPSARAYLGDARGAQVTYCAVAADAPFATDLARLRDDGNVGATSLQILHLLGYRRVVLLGVDGRYVRPSDAATESGSEDPDHFIPGYRRGLNPDASPDPRDPRFVSGWRAAADGAAQVGLDIRNATVGSSVNAFEHCALDEALAWARGADAGPSPSDAS